MGKSYLVEGARLRCMCGSKSSSLKVFPVGHGYTANGKIKAKCTDSLPIFNIPDFGDCKMNKEGKVCKGYMKLAKEWENTGGSSWTLEEICNQKTLTMDSVLLCGRGGIIAPETPCQKSENCSGW